MSCGVGHRCGSDLALLWLWCRPAATAPIRLLAWEPPYAMGVALKKDQKKKNCNIYVYEHLLISIVSFPLKYILLSQGVRILLTF